MKKINRKNIKVDLNLAQLEALLGEELGSADTLFDCFWNFKCQTNQ